jgi:hypothetical protein
MRLKFRTINPSLILNKLTIYHSITVSVYEVEVPSGKTNDRFLTFKEMIQNLKRVSHCRLVQMTCNGSN